MMTDIEAIEAVRNGKKAYTQTCIVPSHPDDANCNHTYNGNPRWRPIACDGDTDVLECPRCGKQKLARCSFDDDFA